LDRKFLRGISLFCKQDVHKNDFFQGALILQGLGDTVNYLGIYHLIHKEFTNSKFLIFIDPVWKDIVDNRLDDCEIIFHPLAGMFGQATEKDRDGNDVFRNNGIDLSFNDLQEKKKNSPLFLLSSLSIGRTTRSFSLHESLLQTNYRLIGFDRDVSKIRPYFPLISNDFEKTDSLLCQLGFKEKEFVVLAPHVDPEKEWGKKNFSILARYLIEQKKIKVVVIGLPSQGYLDVQGVIHCFDLPIPVVGALISKSKLFIGHDSGLTHIASVFSLPVIAIFAKWFKQYPFETRPHSPFSRIIVEEKPGVTDSEIQPETVINVARLVLERETGSYFDKVICPLCSGAMDYIIDANSRVVNYLCVCGSQVLLSGLDRREISGLDDGGDEPSSYGHGEYSYEHKETEGILKISFPKSLAGLNQLAQKIERSNYREIIVDAEFSLSSKFMKISEDFNNINLISCSYEGVFLFFKKFGYILNFSEKVSLSENNLFEKLYFSKEYSDKRLIVPFGKGRLNVINSEIYEKYFLWNSWFHHRSFLEELIRRAVFWKDIDEAILLSKIIFPYLKTPRVLTRMIMLMLKKYFHSSRNNNIK
jgi:hypothetical protein